MARNQVTSIDVAKLAGVSQPTVLRVLDPESPISPSSRAKVPDTATELGYTPNVIARSLKSRNTNIVGIIMANPTSSFFYTCVLERFTHRLASHGYSNCIREKGAYTYNELVKRTWTYKQQTKGDVQISTRTYKI